MEFKKRSLLAYLGIYLRGLAMGAADVVPGVSGGTIAFISGIYEELLNTIKAFNLDNLKAIRKEGVSVFWKKINGNFIVALFAGIVSSIVSLASIISSILEESEPTLKKIALWSFFFGLIIASVLYIVKQVKAWKVKEIIGLLLGGAIAFYVTVAGVSKGIDGDLYLFFAGAIAISAMILPGISGSFILVLLGVYGPVMNYIKTALDTLKTGSYTISELISVGKPIGIFALGCLFGLLTFSRILSWLFKNQENLTLATLTGFMVGSLNKIWPWKNTIIDEETFEIKIENISPSTFSEINKDSFIAYSIGFALLGFALVFGLEFVGNKFKK